MKVQFFINIKKLTYIIFALAIRYYLVVVEREECK
jgi:hypothetical protein